MLEEEEQLEAAGLERERQMLEKVTYRPGPAAGGGLGLPPAGVVRARLAGRAASAVERVSRVLPAVYDAYRSETLARALDAAARRGGFGLQRGRLSLVREHFTSPG